MAERYDEREANACFILGVLLENAGERECAAALFRQAISRQHGLVAPRVRLGFLRWHAEDVTEMYEAFSEAVRIDPQAARAAVQEEPDEARLIHLVLYPKQYGLLPTQDQVKAAPLEVEEWSERLTRAEADIAEGRDEEAITVLESMLHEEPEDQYPVPLLVLAYLLLRAAGGAGTTAISQGSMLLQVNPQLARLLFKHGSS